MSITGVDGAGKDTATKIALESIPSDIKILYIGKPSFLIKGTNETPIQPGITRVLDQLHEIADSRKSRALISATNIMTVLFMWRYQEPYWKKLIKPDLILSIRDGFADPAAYAPYYMGKTFGKLDIPERIDFLQHIHGSPFRDRTIFLEIYPEEAVRRILLRFEAEKNTQAGERPAKWIHQHENLEGITQISQEFRKVLSYLGDKCGTIISIIDASCPPREVGKKITELINCEINA